MSTVSKDIIMIHSLDEIPDSFASEDEEREWWATHEFSDEMYERLPDYTQEHRHWQRSTPREPRHSTGPES
jgi:hypothetical protein